MMVKIYSSVYLLVLIFWIGLVSGGDTISTEGGKCDEPKNVTTTFADGSSRTEHIQDICDKDKHLKCISGRCLCSNADLTFQTFQIKESSLVSRSKRSPKKGKGISKGKAVAGGVIAGAAGGIAGYQLGKAVANSGSSSSGSSSSSNHKSKEKYVTVSSCFARVGGDCALDRNKIVTLENTTVIDNVTTTVRTIKNYKEVPMCVLYAECKAKRVVSPNADTNIGECTCKSGYLKASNDLCTKTTSGVESLKPFGMLFILLTFTTTYYNFQSFSI